MINSRRISKLKRNLYKIKGNPKYSKCIVKVMEGMYLFELKNNAAHHKDLYKKIDKVIDGLEVIELNDYSIEDILVAGNGLSELVVFTGDILEDDINVVHNAHN